jgi:hypothetical protein
MSRAAVAEMLRLPSSGLAKDAENRDGDRYFPT